MFVRRKEISLASIGKRRTPEKVDPYFFCFALHACLVGGWTNALLYRRPFRSLLQRVYDIPMSEAVQESPKMVP